MKFKATTSRGLLLLHGEELEGNLPGSCVYRKSKIVKFVGPELMAASAVRCHCELEYEDYDGKSLFTLSTV
jgi:hypothetical protein